MAGDRDTLRATIPADTAYLHLASNLARNAANAAGLSPADAEKVALATDEAVTNVIRHAYRGDRNRQIEIVVRVLPNGIEVHVIHDGEPIDESALPSEYSADRLLKSGKKGGLGVVLMRRLMDHVGFRSTDDQRNECCLRKYKPETTCGPKRESRAGNG